jgi:hypothetical protein
MMFLSLLRFLPVGLRLLRLMVGIVFLDSGWNDLRGPQYYGLVPKEMI